MHTIKDYITLTFLIYGDLLKGGSQVMGPITRAAHVFMKSNKTEFVLFVSAQGSNYREVGLQLTCSLILLSFHTNTRTRPTSIEDRSRSSVSCSYSTIFVPIMVHMSEQEDYLTRHLHTVNLMTY